MTQQDDITQPVLTEPGIQALWNEACKDSPKNPGWKRHIRFARAIEQALSKLHTPVADSTLPLEKALHELVSKIAPGLDTGDILQDAQRASAMLDAIQASSPVADERAVFKKCHATIIKALAAIAMADGPDTRKEDDPELIYRERVMDDVVRIRVALDECSAALASAPVAKPAPEHFKPPFDNCSFRMCDLPGQCRGEGKCHHPASAPVAGEAQSLAEVWRVNAAEARAYGKDAEATTLEECAKELDALNAAPQASAEGIRSASNACMHRNECRAMLDRQQRADESAVRRALVAASNYIDTLGGDSKSYRAALSATQPEQGERDEA